MILKIGGKSDEDYFDVMDNGFDLEDAVVTGHSLC
jgi:hypothetical protein